MTLRLLHLPRSSPKLDSVRRGEFTYISPKNEAAVLSSLKTVCERVIEQAESGMVRLSAVDARGDESQSGVEMVRALWEEELEIARAVLLRVEEGEDLS